MVTFLADAVALALTNVHAGQLPFGALVVRDGEILATGVNTTLRGGDPTAHAEVEAIRAACRALGTLRLEKAEVYTSCEPCAMCQAVGVAAGITRMTFAASSAEAADHGLPADALSARMQVAWRDAHPAFLTQGAVDGAIAPFGAWLRERTGGR